MTESIKKYLGANLTIDEMLVNLDLDYDRLISLLNPENRYIFQVNDE